jgi:hypothetical protein
MDGTEGKGRRFYPVSLHEEITGKNTEPAMVEGLIPVRKAADTP